MGHTMLRLVGLGLLALGASCAFAEDGLDQQAGAEPSQAGPSTPAGTMAPAEGAASAQALLRAHKVEAKQMSVGILFARKVHAKEGTVTTAGPPLSPAELGVQIGGQDVEMPELTVDILYADEVEAKVLSVRELHASDVKIGEGEGAGH